MFVRFNVGLVGDGLRFVMVVGVVISVGLLMYYGYLMVLFVRREDVMFEDFFFFV